MKVDKYLLAKMNRRNIIETIRKHGPINKAAIASHIGLSIPSVMKITDDLEKTGLIRVIGKGKSIGGKRPQLLQIVDDSAFIIGVDVGRYQYKVVIMSIGGNIAARTTKLTGPSLPAINLIKRLIDSIQAVITQSGIMPEKILGIGIGMPGLLDCDTGEVLFSPDFGWENIRLVQAVQEQFPYNICIENSNRTLAMGEYWFGTAADDNNFLCVNLGHGIGSAIVQQGELYRGSSGTSGELGHSTVEKDGPICVCGNAGCLEALASGDAIAKQARQGIKNGMQTAICAEDTDTIQAKHVFDAARNGDSFSISLIKRAAEYIGIALANCINLLDPEAIVLAGGLTKSQDLLLPEIKRTTKKHQMKFAGRHVKLKIAALGDDATAIGAASLILKKYIENGGDGNF